MRRLVAKTVLGAQVAAFAVVCLISLPMILFMFSVNWVRYRIESRWPDNERAQAVSYWFGLLAPVALLVVLAVTLEFAIANIRAIKHAAPAAAPR